MTTVDLEQQRLLIGGEWTEAGGGKTFERTDPFNGDTVALAAAAGREDARRAVGAAAAAFPAWSATPAGERRALLNAAADQLMEAAPDIAATMTEEVGGTFGWACSTAISPPACCARPPPRPTPWSAR
jgi:vanillin dehydrogenase